MLIRRPNLCCESEVGHLRGEPIEEAMVPHRPESLHFSCSTPHLGLPQFCPHFFLPGQAYSEVLLGAQAVRKRVRRHEPALLAPRAPSGYRRDRLRPQATRQVLAIHSIRTRFCIPGFCTLVASHQGQTQNHTT